MSNRKMNIKEIKEFETCLVNRGLSGVYRAGSRLDFHNENGIEEDRFISIEFKNDEVVICHGLEIKTGGKGEETIIKLLSEVSNFEFVLAAVKDDLNNAENNYLELLV